MKTITQSQPQWLDVSDFEDVVFFLEVRELTGAVSMTYQTSPNEDEASFLPVLPTFAMVASDPAQPLATASTRVQVAPASIASAPIATYLRWQVTTSSATIWDVTFKLWIVLNGPDA